MRQWKKVWIPVFLALGIMVPAQICSYGAFGDATALGDFVYGKESAEEKEEPEEKERPEAKEKSEAKEEPEAKKGLEVKEGPETKEALDRKEGLSREEESDWYEEYTDTDTRRGILALRVEAFQGFHGVVLLTVREKNGGREWSIELDSGRMYLANLELPVGTYRIAGLEAVSDGREFDCIVEQEEWSVEDGGTSFGRITVMPGSLYRIPYEEKEPGADTDIVEEGSQVSVGNTGHTENNRSDGLGAENSSTDGGEQNNSSLNNPTKPAASVFPWIPSDSRQTGKIPALLIIGLLGIAVCTSGLFHVLKTNWKGKG